MYQDIVSRYQDIVDRLKNEADETRGEDRERLLREAVELITRLRRENQELIERAGETVLIFRA